MTNFFTICVLMLLAVSASAADPIELAKCPDYLAGLANPKIVHFGDRTPIQEMANVMLNHVPQNSAEQVQVAMPIFLEVNPNQPQEFGDGQQNAFASFGVRQHTPFKAILTRRVKPSDPSDLAIILAKDLPGFGVSNAVEVSILGQSQILPLDTSGMVRLPVNLQQLAWDQMTGAKPIYFRLVGVADWFAVEFPNPYISIEELVGGMKPSLQKLPSGKSVIDPLGVKGSTDIQNALLKLDVSQNPGFQLDRRERVHGVYWAGNDDKGPKILTAHGGLVTRYRLDDAVSFKIVYLAKDPRVLGAEVEEGVVSGTGPHFIGANGEIILNSLGQEPLMTFYGVPAPLTAPIGGKLAGGYTHQWVGTWLNPDQAFVTPHGLYHWHLNHLLTPIAAQVFTPPEVPSDQNHFGFPRQ